MYTHEQIKKTVQYLTKKYKTNDPFELADFNNILVIQKPLGSIYGFYKYIRKNRVIFINNSIETVEKKVVCAHELGHAILHPYENCTFLKKYTLFSTNRLEKEANLFTSFLLLPDEILEKYKDYTIYQISAITFIPLEHIYIRHK
ncbi:MAG: ImmA/IrrE family metallo-endopeptidase [Candidatus Aenigmatarchaeota archaeon]